MNSESDEQEIDYEIAADEQSRKIKKLERELRSVSMIEDRKLLVWLSVGLLAILLQMIKPSHVTQLLVLILVPFSIFGGLSYCIYQNIQKKKKILIKHGLRCNHCGFIPSTLNASGVLLTQKCLQCHADL